MSVGAKQRGRRAAGLGRTLKSGGFGQQLGQPDQVAGRHSALGSTVLGIAVRPGQAGINNEAVAVTHERMAGKAEFGLAARPLAVEPGIGVGGAGVGGVLLRRWPLKSPSRLRPGTGGLPEPSFGRKLLVDAPGLHHRAIHADVRRRQQALHLGVGQHGGQDFVGHITGSSRPRVLAERRWVPDRIVNAQVHEAAEQQVELQPLRDLGRKTTAVAASSESTVERASFGPVGRSATAVRRFHLATVI